MLETFMGGMAPADFYTALIQIILLDLVLAGDNAVVIAMACRTLPADKRMMGILLGAGAAVLLRIIFAIGVTSLLKTPWLQAIGSVLLIWVAIKLLADDGHGHDNVEGATSIWSAVKIIVIADVVMSLDNVLAIAAAANGNWWLIVFGIAFSVPIVIFGSTFVVWLLEKAPILIWGAAALLGWIAGTLLVTDIALVPYAKQWAASLGLDLIGFKRLAGVIGVMLVLGVAAWLRASRAKA